VSWTTERARIASLSRSRSSDDPELLQARVNLKIARAKFEADRRAEDVARVVSELPPLTDEQLDLIVTVLRPRGGGR
jgi:hypothetical protein